MKGNILLSQPFMKERNFKKKHFSCLLCTCVCVLTHPFLANQMSSYPQHLLSLIYDALDHNRYTLDGGAVEIQA